MSDNLTPSNIGQKNFTGNDRELFKVMYESEVQAAFYRKNVLSEGRIMTKRVSGAKSIKFPTVGLAKARYQLVKGAEIYGDPQEHSEIEIAFDRALTSASFVDNYDEFMAHYDVRAPYANAQGEKLAEILDRNGFRTMIKAARSANTITGLPGGSEVIRANADTDANALVAAYFAAMVELEEKGIPTNDALFGYLRPAQWSLIVANSDKGVSRDFSAVAGDYNRNEIKFVAGIPVIKTTNLLMADQRTDASITAAGLDPLEILAKYRLDTTNTVSVIAHKMAVGQLIGKDVTMDVIEQKEKLGTLLLAQLFTGMDVLRPETAVEIKKA